MTVPTISENQKQTEETFGFKWGKRETYESDAYQAEWKRWLYEKYFDSEELGLNEILKGGRKRILDAGCGSGGSGYVLFGSKLKEHEYVGVDISESIEVGKERFEELGLPAKFIRADLNEIPDELGLFDIILSEGVLHHKESVEKAIANLSLKLKPNGKFLFYVYVKKAPIREYTDDMIREAISGMGNEEAWAALKPLTKLGKQLGELNIELNITEDIPFLGISKGKIDIQRLFFYKR